jgi:outer membrane protein TolC
LTAAPRSRQAQRLAAQLRGQRTPAAVFLVKALGGDWPGKATLATGTDSARSVR